MYNGSSCHKAESVFLEHMLPHFTQHVLFRTAISDQVSDIWDPVRLMLCNSPPSTDDQEPLRVQTRILYCDPWKIARISRAQNSLFAVDVSTWESTRESIAGARPRYHQGKGQVIKASIMTHSLMLFAGDRSCVLLLLTVIDISNIQTKGSCHLQWLYLLVV